LADEVVGNVGGVVTHGDETIGQDVARERIFDMAAASVDGALPQFEEPSKIQLDALTGPVTASPALSHSYTSLSTYDECPRQHYLEYVVNGFPDYRETGDDFGGGATQRDVGLLFHDTAEQAAHENVRTVERWYDICERLAKQRHATDALPAAKECIDRYFELEVSEYEVVDAERDFELDLDGMDLVGSIDVVYRTPEGELLVVDYKATERKRDLETDHQLPIYLLACRELYESPPTRAAYAYVGSLGPTVEERSFDEAGLRSVREDVVDTMQRIRDHSYEEYSSGDHCRWCGHNTLPCAPDPLDPLQ
jgi:DNA helicase-2/ATP-dependent DNA helicase PcrA